MTASPALPDGGRLAAVASKVGLSGRAAAAVPDARSAERARKGAERAGTLVEVEVADPRQLPFEDGAFNVVVIDDTAGLLSSSTDEDRGAIVREAARILEPGGRAMVVGRGEPSGLAALVARKPNAPPFDAQPVLHAHGFKAVRLLAEREGFTFVEGLKHRV